jgi:hypothetical protein
LRQVNFNTKQGGCQGISAVAKPTWFALDPPLDKKGLDLAHTP